MKTRVDYVFTAAASQSNVSFGLLAPELSQWKRKPSLICPRKQQPVKKGTSYLQALFCVTGVPWFCNKQCHVSGSCFASAGWIHCWWLSVPLCGVPGIWESAGRSHNCLLPFHFRCLQMFPNLTLRRLSGIDWFLLSRDLTFFFNGISLYPSNNVCALRVIVASALTLKLYWSCN